MTAAQPNLRAPYFEVGIAFLLRFFEGTTQNIELRAFAAGKDGPYKDRAFTRDPGELDTFLRNNSHHEVYFGCATREGCTFGTKEFCREVPVLWADLDFKDVRVGSEARAHELLSRFAFAPSLVIHSGGGFHLYWLLKEPLRPQQDARLELVLKKITESLCADRAAAELARVLRVPGTLNHKYENPREVQLVEANWELRYGFEQFVEHFSAKNGDAPSYLRTDKPRGGELTEENDYAGVDLYSEEKIPYGQHYHELLRIAGRMRHDGANQIAIAAHLLLACKARCEDYGSDWREMCHTIAKEVTRHYEPAAARVVEVEHASSELGFKDMPETALDGRLGEICQKELKDFPRGASWVTLTTIAGVTVPESSQSYVRTNLYAGIVADPHDGKSQVIRRGMMILDMKPPLLVNTFAGSAEGLVKKIGATGEARLLSVDELSHLMAKANIDRASFPYILNHAYYENSFSMMIAQQKELRFNARLTVLGGIVTKNFEQSFSHTTAFGLHDRFIFALWPTGFEYDFRPFEGEVLTDNPAAVTIHKEVWNVKKSWAKENPELTGRFFENALRVAVICAAFDGRSELKAEDLGPARAFAEYQLRVKGVLSPNPGENQEAKCAFAILEYLKHHKKFVNRREVYRRVNADRFGPGVFDHAIKNLIYNGDLEQTGKRPKLLKLVGEEES